MSVTRYNWFFPLLNRYTKIRVLKDLTYAIWNEKINEMEIFRNWKKYSSYFAEFAQKCIAFLHFGGFFMAKKVLIILFFKKPLKKK